MTCSSTGTWRLLQAVVALSVAATTFTAAPLHAQTVLKLGNVQPTGMIVQDGLKHFAALVKERTGGAVEIQIFPAAQLGSEQEMLEGIKLGTLHMFEGSTGSVGRFLPELEAFAHPYVWRDLDHMLKVTRGDIGNELSEKLLKQHGMRILDMGWLFGRRHLTTRNTAVRTPADMRGLKIRVQPTAIYLATIKAMGGNPTPVDFNELYSSLQTGVVDGQENPAGLIWSAKFAEVQNYLMLTGHIMQQQTILIGEDTYQSLTAERRKILQQAAYDAGNYQNDLIDKDEADSLVKLKAAGMKIVEPDVDAFRAATADVYKAFENKWGKGYFERIQATR